MSLALFSGFLVGCAHFFEAEIANKGLGGIFYIGIGMVPTCFAFNTFRLVKHYKNRNKPDYVNIFAYMKNKNAQYWIVMFGLINFFANMFLLEAYYLCIVNDFNTGIVSCIVAT